MDKHPLVNGPLPLRLLVVASEPDPSAPAADLAVERLLVATAELQRRGQLAVEFLVNPAVGVLTEALAGGEFAAVHFAGPPGAGAGASQTAVGAWFDAWPHRPEPLAELLPEHASASPLRPWLVVLDSGAAGQQVGDGWSRHVDRLAAAGVPAVVGIASTLPRAAVLDVSRALYRAFVDGDDLGVALSNVCLRVSGAWDGPAATAGVVTRITDGATRRRHGSPASQRPSTHPADTNNADTDDTARVGPDTADAPEPVGRGAALRDLAAACRRDAWRGLVLHGPGGSGKSTLAAALARQLQADGTVRHVIQVSAGPTLSADVVLERIGATLALSGGGDTAHVLRQPISIEAKAQVFGRDLRAQPVAIVLDDADRLLAPPEVAAHAAADWPDGLLATGDVRSVIGNPDLARLVTTLIEMPDPGLRFIFTSRIDFDPLTCREARDLEQFVTGLPGRLLQRDASPPWGAARASDASRAFDSPERTSPFWSGLARAEIDSTAGTETALPVGHVRHMAVEPLDFVASAQLMLRHPVLGALPLRSLGDAVSKRRVFEVLGGDPWAIEHFARLVEQVPLPQALASLADELPAARTARLIDRTTARLASPARALLIAASVFDEPVDLAGLARIVEPGPGQPVAAAGGPPGDAIAELAAAGFLTCSAGDGRVELAGPVRTWARRRVDLGQRPSLLRRAARHWLTVGRETRDLDAELIARRYLFLAGDYGEADAIVQLAWESLLRAGQVERLLRLLGESVATLVGLRRAIALDRLAGAYHILGDGVTALPIQEAALRAFEAHGDWRQVVETLQRLGRMHQDRGQAEQAQGCYERALKITEGMGDRGAQASSLRHLGVLHQRQDDHDRALDCWRRALELTRADGDRHQSALLLHQLAMVHEIRGDVGRAISHYEDALALQSGLGDGAAMAGTLHQLGLLHEVDHARDKARVCYEQSWTIAETAGDKAGMALSLYQLGMLHRHGGDDAPARDYFERSLAVQRDLGADSIIAATLYQIGLLDDREGRRDDAHRRLTEALAVAERTGDRLAMVRALRRLGQISEADGRLQDAVVYRTRSMVVLNGLRSPDRDIEAGSLADLRRLMPPEVFGQALRAGLPGRRTG